MNRDTAYVGPPQLNLPGMKTGAYRQADLMGGAAKRKRAADSASRPVEGGEHAIASRLYKYPAMPRDGLTRKSVVLVKATPPLLVA